MIRLDSDAEMEVSKMFQETAHLTEMFTEAQRISKSAWTIDMVTYFNKGEILAYAANKHMGHDGLFIEVDFETQYIKMGTYTGAVSNIGDAAFKIVADIDGRFWKDGTPVDSQEFADVADNVLYLLGGASLAAAVSKLEADRVEKMKPVHFGSLKQGEKTAANVCKIADERGFCDDHYHDLIVDSARVLVAEGRSDWTYMTGYTRTTIWSKRNATVSVNPETREIS